MGGGSHTSFSHCNTTIFEFIYLNSFLNLDLNLLKFLINFVHKIHKIQVQLMWGKSPTHPFSI